MYRRFNGVSIYCPRWPCDRNCGLFHLKYLRVRRKENNKEKVDSQWKRDEKGDNASDSYTLKQSSRPNLTGASSHQQQRDADIIFEEIMKEAARKISDSYEEPPLPPPIEFKERLGDADRINHPSEDTTTLQYNMPIWDNENLRHELLDSDEEHYVVGDPVFISEYNDSSTDELIEDMKHDPFSNPLDKERKTSQLFSDDSDNDYTTVDLTQKISLNRPSMSERSIVSHRLLRGNKFEKSIDTS